MSKINIRFIVYNAYGIGGTVKTVFNFANYFAGTGRYEVEIFSIRRNREKTTLPLDGRVNLKVAYDARRGVGYSLQDRQLLESPSQLMSPEEDLYPNFSLYTDRKLLDYYRSLRDGALITTFPSLNMLSSQYADGSVLCVGQEHKSYADHSAGIRKLIWDYYGNLDVLTILTEKSKLVYERRIKGEVSVHVLGNGTERLPYRAMLDSKTIIAAGRYHSVKGYDMLIQAFAHIADQYPDWTVRICGLGDMVQEYERLIRSFGVETRIILEDGTDRLDEKFSEAAFHVCPSYYESFGMTIIEGFAMGVPCVAFACDGPAEIITHGYDGLLVEKENIQALAEAMERLIADENFRQELGKHAYGTAEKYDLRKIGKNFEEVIEKGMETVGQKRLSGGRDSREQGTAAIGEPFSPYHYAKMVEAAGEGRVGAKTILRMAAEWLRHKAGKLHVQSKAISGNGRD